MHELIGTEIDKLGSEVNLYFCTGEGITPELHAFFERQVALIIEKGYASVDYLPDLVQIKAKVIYVTIDNEIAAHIIWRWESPEKVYIILTAISDKYEKRGLYAIMHRYYEDRIKKGGAIFSKSFLHIHNKRIIDISRKNGYTVELIKMSKKLQ